MNYAVKAGKQADDALYGVAQLSKLQQAKIAGINFVRFVAEETIQNAIMAGLGPEGYTDNDLAMDIML